jgi:transposase
VSFFKLEVETTKTHKGLMERQVKELDFSGQNIYVGLDTHRKQITVTVLGENLTHKTFSQPPDANALTRYLRRNFPGANYFAAYEAGFSGFWLQEVLQSQGINCIVVNAADVPTKDKERKQKNDRVDSRKIAYSLRKGDLEAIYIPSKQCQRDRSLLRARQRIVTNQTRCRNRIKALLNFFGINYPEKFTKSGTHWSRRFMAWLKSVDLGESGNDTLSIYLEEAEFLRALLAKTMKKINSLSGKERYSKWVKLLISVPGIGRLTAMILLTELEHIDRFKDRDALCNYIGLVPDVRASDQTVHVGDITQRGNRILKKCLVESTWVAARTDTALTMKYNQLCSRMNGNKAIIRIARMLLNRIRFVLIHQQEYQMAVAA